MKYIEISSIDTNSNTPIQENNKNEVITQKNNSNQWVKYALKNITPTITFKDPPLLIQKINLKDKGTKTYENMGLWEFENGSLENTIESLLKYQQAEELVLFSDQDEKIQGLCHISMIKESLKQAHKLIRILEGKGSTTNITSTLRESLEDKTCTNFLSLENNYFFSTSGDTLKFLEHLAKVQKELQEGKDVYISQIRN